MSLYGKYVKERMGKSIIEDERGFAVYSFVEGSCFLDEIFVDLNYRLAGIGSLMLDEVSRVAREKGCKAIFATIYPSVGGSTDAMKAALSYGFKLHGVGSNFVVIQKDLGD